MTASIVAVCVLIPGPAAAQGPLPINQGPLPINLPETGIEPVDEIGQTVEQVVGSLAPGVVDPGTSDSTDKPQTIEAVPAQPVDQPSADPQTPPTQEPTAEGADSSAEGADSTPSAAPSQDSGSGSAAQGNRGEAPRAAERKRDDPADAEAAAQTALGQASAEGDRPAPNVLERIVDIVPMPLIAALGMLVALLVLASGGGIVPMALKIALGMLVALLVLAIGGVRSTRRRLALAERRAATDGLTGLPNRRHAHEVIERLLAAARRNNRPLSVMIFDLDHFKEINDGFGHAIGDDALRATAGATRELLRGSDYVARFGGEEFLVLLPETSGADAMIAAETLRSRLAELEVAELEGAFTASFGVAVYPDDGIGADELFKAADTALYSAKEGGRNRVETSHEALLPRARAGASMRGSNRALAGDGTVV